MTLDGKFFRAVDLPVVSGRYYEADKVDKLLEEIERRAAGLIRENERLRAMQKNRSERQLEYAIGKVQQMHSSLRERNARADEELNSMFQDFLAGFADADMPEDLESKVSRIAEEVREIDADI